MVASQKIPPAYILYKQVVSYRNYTINLNTLDYFQPVPALAIAILHIIHVFLHHEDPQPANLPVLSR